jgi:hypothetical protein
MKILRKEKSNLKQIRIVHRIHMNKNNALMNVLRYRKSECDYRIYGIVLRVLMNYGQRISEFVRYRKNNVILGFTMWHFQRFGYKVRRWRRLLSCLSQEYLKKNPNT